MSITDCYTVTVSHCRGGEITTGTEQTVTLLLSLIAGVVRSLHEQNRLLHYYCTETRPYNQGSRLTAYELVHDKIPSTLICDSMAAMLMQVSSRCSTRRGL